MPAYPKSKQLAWNKVDKPKKVNHGKKGDSQKKLGEISPKVRAKVKARSGDICEIRVKCQGAPATDMAHLTGRAVIDHRTDVDDLKHACRACHMYLDSDGKGVKLKKSLRKGA